MKLNLFVLYLFCLFIFSGCTVSNINRIIVYDDEYKGETALELNQNITFKPVASKSGSFGKYVKWHLTYKKKADQSNNMGPTILTFSANLKPYERVDSLLFIESNNYVNEFVFRKVNSTFFIDETHSTSTNTDTETVTETTPETTVDSKNNVSVEQKSVNRTNVRTNTTNSLNRKTMRHVVAEIELTPQLIDDIIETKELTIQLYIDGRPYKSNYSLSSSRLKLVEFLDYDAKLKTK